MLDVSFGPRQGRMPNVEKLSMALKCSQDNDEYNASNRIKKY